MGLGSTKPPSSMVIFPETYLALNKIRISQNPYEAKIFDVHGSLFSEFSLLGDWKSNVGRICFISDTQSLN